MKKLAKLMAIAAITVPALWSCSGGSGPDTLLYGKLPGVYAGMMSDREALLEEAKSASSESQFKSLSEKADQLQEEWSEKIEEAAKANDGRQLEITDSDLTVSKPLTLTYKGFFSKNDMTPYYSVDGEAEAATDIAPESALSLSSYTVYIVGYDSEGKEVFESKVGFIEAQKEGDRTVIKAGTPVKFDQLQFSPKKIEGYQQATVLKLEARK